jgi:ABC-type thiamine transport system ATPase subunit
LGAWAEVAGPVPLPFALEHEREIRAAAELHAGLGTRATAAGTDGPGDDVAAELAQAILARVRAVRALTSGDTLPLVVDDPFTGLDPALKPVLLEMLAAQAGDPQLIVVTADDDVVAWARTEARRGRMALVEPTITDGAIAAPAP